ncbi:hypothetical protein B0H21DRAFT_776497 [Amylocystis lapponica]|nr:hypothetical protein B0H21DRAFT_776497 [Amylocystis lapponica]
MKLEMFCRMAREAGCDWAWSDTCCIDKRSSAELDESIRSMYQWYSEAKVCIVHLGMTSNLDDMHGDDWFRRGWTLQELLAPSRIKFFNRDWEPLTDNENDKDEDTILISITHITMIPFASLREFTPGVDKIREKMIWASRRETTRVEDVAYALIGLFNVSMNIAYGEGDRAFYRLQVTIMEKSNNLELLLWLGNPENSRDRARWPLVPRHPPTVARR